MKLGICIYHSLGGDVAYDKTVESVEDIFCQKKIYFFNTFVEVKEFLKIAKEDWFLILSDREIFDYRLVAAMNVLLSQQDIEAYSFHCVKSTNTDPVITKSIRLIKKGIELQELFLLPRNLDAKVVNILDGWIYDYNTDFSKICRT